MAVEEVVNWAITSKGNPSPLPHGPEGLRQQRTGFSMQEMMSAIARWRDTQVTKVGTPVDNQIGVWTGDGTIEGDPNFIWDGNNLDIILGATGGIRTTSVSTDATLKSNRFLLRHYANAEEDIAFFGAVSFIGSTDLRFGGGYGLQNAATQIQFYTAADTTTLSGTVALTINSSGDATFENLLSAKGDTVNFGDDDVLAATVSIFGNGTGNVEGGELRLYMSADHDTTYEFYFFDIVSDDLRIGRAGNVDFLLDQAGDATFSGALDVQGAFTSPGIGDNATAERLQLTDAELILGASGTTVAIRNAVNDQAIILSGGNVSNVGANIRLDGGAAGSTGDMTFRNDGNTWMLWDESVGDLEILTGVGGKTSALTIDSSQDATFAGDVVVQSDNVYPNPVQTVITTTSGTAAEFTSIPSWVKKITLTFAGFSTNGTSRAIIQIGDSGGYENTGYLGSVSNMGNSTPSSANHTDGFRLYSSAWSAGLIMHGSMVLTLLDAATFTWTCIGSWGRSDGSSTAFVGGSKILTAALDRIQVTTQGGSDTLDAGVLNALFE